MNSKYIKYFHFENYLFLFTINIKSRYKNQENVVDLGFIISLFGLNEVKLSQYDV